MNRRLPQVDRVLDLRHGSRLDPLEAALGAVFCAAGKRVTIQAKPAAQSTAVDLRK